MLASQFLSKPLIKPVIVIAGPNDLVRATCSSYVLDEMSAEVVERFDVVRDPPEIVDAIRRYDPFAKKRVLLLDSFNRAADSLRSSLLHFAERPTPDTIIVCLAASIRDTNGERWIQSHGNVLYVDCGNMTENGLRQLVSGSLPANADVDYVVSLADLDIVFEILELSSIFKDFPNSDSMHPAVATKTPFQDYLIYNVTDARRLHRRLCDRLRQILVLSGIKDMKMSIMERSRRAHLEPFVAKALQPLASKSQRDLLLKYLEVNRAARYVDQPGFVEYLGLQICL